jgi:hypothetical protein
MTFLVLWGQWRRPEASALDTPYRNPLLSWRLSSRLGLQHAYCSPLSGGHVLWKR